VTLCWQMDINVISVGRWKTRRRVILVSSFQQKTISSPQSKLYILSFVWNKTCVSEYRHYFSCTWRSACNIRKSGQVEYYLELHKWIDLTNSRWLINFAYRQVLRFEGFVRNLRGKWLVIHHSLLQSFLQWTEKNRYWKLKAVLSVSCLSGNKNPKMLTSRIVLVIG
jgi:hypothetical protein